MRLCEQNIVTNKGANYGNSDCTNFGSVGVGNADSLPNQGSHRIGKIADAMDRIANVIDNSSEDSNELKRKLEEMKGKES